MDACSPGWGTPLTLPYLGRIPNKVGDPPEVGCSTTVVPVQSCAGTGSSPPVTHPSGPQNNRDSGPSNFGRLGSTGLLLSSSAYMPPPIFGQKCNTVGRSPPPFSPQGTNSPVRTYKASWSRAVQGETRMPLSACYQILLVRNPPLPPPPPSA